MKDELVRTGVDELLELLAHNNKLPLTEVATRLKVDVGVVQAWVDFLVEESIVGIEYKFTTPYIYMNKVVEKKTSDDTIKEDRYNIQFFKKQFWDKAKTNNIPENQVEMLWKNHVAQALELEKKYFFFEAQRRKLVSAEKLWKEYAELVQSS